uniref:Uncharacterized protein n=1 Tax=Arundo donax TaxID=35708 RepID=A0A0A9H7H7_ARUDO
MKFDKIGLDSRVQIHVGTPRRRKELIVAVLDLDDTLS